MTSLHTKTPWVVALLHQADAESTAPIVGVCDRAYAIATVAEPCMNPAPRQRRIDILHEQLGFERERIWEWGLAHAVLSAWWGMEDNTGWEYALAFAEMISALDIK